MTFDLAIAGNGVLGLSSAFAFHRLAPSATIAIIGPGDRPGGATLAAGAMHGVFGEVTALTSASPHMLLKFGWALEARKHWPAWRDAINARVPVNRQVESTGGTIVVLNSVSGRIDDEAYLEIARLLALYGEPHEALDPSMVPGLAPLEDCRPFRALHIPGEGRIDPARLLAGLTEALRRTERVSFIDDEATGIRVEGGWAAGLALRSGTVVRSGRTLVAAGAGTAPLMASVPEVSSRMPGVFAGVGCSLEVARSGCAIDHVVRTPNRSFACGLHALPGNGGHLYIGATNYLKTAPQVRPTLSDVHFLIDCAVAQIGETIQGGHLVEAKVGNRPVSLDGLPLIGGTCVGGLFVLTGTYRDGIHLSPLLADRIARQMLADGTEPEPDFPVERRPIPLSDWAITKTRAVDHFMSVLYENQAALPRCGWQALQRDHLRSKVERLYADLDTDFPLPPEFLPIIDLRRETMVPFFRDAIRSLQSAHS
ncbi:FAD-dependent oxidoreductase [Azospirillum brasilense]|uniref:FAD-dependent oxidoreductase n=1 Tax=Azospirillum brasilense TaxID=192 RepID=UPI0013B3C6CF|nr:FAD-dependent oxidoreductase [Azospirillum brasilense]